MSAIQEFERARDDLEALLIELLTSMFPEEVIPAWGELPAGPLATARLEIHDEVDDSYTVVEVRVGTVMARVLTSRMMSIADPGPEDLLDAIGELGNIAGGNVKSLLRHSCRLSLPAAEISDGPVEVHPDAVTVRAGVLGQVVELSIRAAEESDGAFWPGSLLIAGQEAPATAPTPHDPGAGAEEVPRPGAVETQS